ncbi:MAG: hypothetical protein ACI9HK_004610 [Pirellulaceae bacterium]|jgi:hypothetical protein
MIMADQQSMTDGAANAEHNEDGEGDGEYEEQSGGNRMMFLAMPSWLVSLFVHVVMLVVLGVITLDPGLESVKHVLTIGTEKEEIDELEEIQEEDITEPIEVQADASEMEVVQEEEVVPTDTLVPANDPDVAAVHVEITANFSQRTAPRNDLMREIGALTGSGVDGRGAAARGKMVARYGGTKGSEEAVALALKWLAEHQLQDGSWNFDHRQGRCQGRCSHQGSAAQARNGATGLALLPFLGAGHTHLEGEYKDTVRAGLYYLMNKMKPDGSLHEAEGSMYSHGICSIVLCEAYAMTHDRDLMAPAQASLNFIVAAQDPVGGGWRYQPKSPGDTSAVGWQLMALKSGHMAYLHVPPQTIQGAIKFLDSVQQDSGSKYGYTTPGAGRATTAIGLLSRMYLGWKKDNPAIERGVEFLGALGPSGNMYYNYYATQVMKQSEGEPWKKWNVVMREQLVNSQDKTGHQKGSWHMQGGGDHGSERGGRLYQTAMATMVLEVYYRHMPIYQKQASEEDFPL